VKIEDINILSCNVISVKLNNGSMCNINICAIKNPVNTLVADSINDNFLLCKYRYYLINYTK